MRPWRTAEGTFMPPQGVLDTWQRAEAEPWTPAHCQPTGLCDGTYSRVKLPCPHSGKPSCPRALDMAIIRQRMWLEAAGIGEQYRDVDARRIPEFARIRDWCGSFANNPKTCRGLILSGGTGTGKTMALTYIILQAMHIPGLRPGDARVWFAPELVSWLCDPSHNVAEVAKLDLLCIDDFGCEYPAEWTLARLGDLVERRHRDRRPIVVTTNLAPQAMSERHELGRIADRWRETCDVVLFTGESQRGRAA